MAEGNGNAPINRAVERTRKDERNRTIMEMWKAGSTDRQIADYFTSQGQRITRRRVNGIIHEALREARDSRIELATAVFDGELERLTGVIRNAWAIVTANCRSCRGSGTLEAVPGVPATADTCKTCNGDGKANHPDVRIRALKEVRAAIDQRAKMLGLYEAEHHVVHHEGEVGLRLPDMSNLADDDLDRALADYQAGVEAGMRLAGSSLQK